MKSAIFKIFFAVIFVGLVTSCENYLDPGHDETLTKSEVFSSYIYSVNYVSTMYSYLPSGSSTDMFASDEAKHTDERSAFLIMNDGSWTSRTYVDSWTWGRYYAGIRRVHIFLENVDKAIFLDPNTFKKTPYVNDTLRKQYRGEARFLRAFYYFELLKRFGNPAKNLGVPIVPERVLAISDTLDFARNSYEDCVNYIVRDCDSAASVLPERREASDYGKASKGAALALKSRLLLYAASPLANPSGDLEKWKAAAAAAKAVLDMPSYSLMTSAENMLPIFTKPNNSEVLFSGPVSQSISYEQSILPPAMGGGGQINPTQELVNAFETRNGIPVDVAPDGTLSSASSSFNPNDPYKKRDPRLEYFIGYNGTVINTYNKVTSIIESYAGGKDGIGLYPNSTKTGYYIRKFNDPSVDILTDRAKATHFWVHFRLAEIYLNYAEAMAEAYGVKEKPAGYALSAFDALKKVRVRGFGSGSASNGLDLLPVSDFINRVRNERRVELCFEGHRFWDVRRWKLGEKYFNVPIHGVKVTKTGTGTGAVFSYSYFKVEDRVFTPKMYVMPLPYDEMQRSKLLIQNEDW